MCRRRLEPLDLVPTAGRPRASGRTGFQCCGPAPGEWQDRLRRAVALETFLLKRSRELDYPFWEKARIIGRVSAVHGPRRAVTRTDVVGARWLPYPTYTVTLRQRQRPRQRTPCQHHFCRPAVLENYNPSAAICKATGGVQFKFASLLYER